MLVLHFKSERNNKKQKANTENNSALFANVYTHCAVLCVYLFIYLFYCINIYILNYDNAVCI